MLKATEDRENYPSLSNVHETWQKTRKRHRKIWGYKRCNAPESTETRNVIDNDQGWSKTLDYIQSNSNVTQVTHVIWPQSVHVEWLV